jgi:membrane-associated protease RseP (regulator of RpoE activity)
VVLLGIVAFVVALIVSVVLHEAGHFLTARRYGMKATQFFVGFGPTLWSRQRGETEYGFKAIPAGGFVKIVGMTPLEEIEPEDEDRAFYRQSAGKKAIVLSAGSVVHFIIAIALVFATVFAFGTVDDQAPVLSAPAQELPTSVQLDGEDLVASDATVTAPAAGVLQQGDRVLSVDGTATPTWDDVVAVVRDRGGQDVPFVLERDGQQLTVQLTPVEVTRPQLGDDGLALPSGETEQVGAVGVGQGVVFTRPGPAEAVGESVDTVGLIITGTYAAITEKLGTITGIYGPERDPEGLIGVVGATRVSGEVAALEIPFAQRVASFLILIAGINFFIGVFNLLPLLPLDGGHLAVLGYENARDRLRRLRGYRGEFQRVDFNKLMPVTYAVVLAFIGLTVFIAGADIVNPVRLTQ